MGNLFIERSINGALGFFKEAMFSDEIAKSEGLLQSVGPVFKIAMLILLLLAVCFARTLTVLAGLYALSLILAVSSGINLVFFFKRVWVFIPLFTAVIAIPAVFTQGLYTAVLFVLRVAACVSFVVLVTVTTEHSRLLKALRSIGVPAIFVAVLDMTYRYIFLFIKTFEEMHLGLKGRLIESFKGAEGRFWVASRIAFLFRRSLKMSEEVYMAMLARGYHIEERRGK